MAKALFNSPRYDKRENSNGCYNLLCYGFNYGLIIAVSFVIGSILEELLRAHGINIHNLAPGFLLGGFILPPFIYLLFNKKDSSYEQYKKRIIDKKDLFHNGGKPLFIIPKSDINDRHGLYVDLSLRLLAAVMKADKEERVVEMDIIKSFIHNNYPRNNKKYSIKLNEFKSYLKEDYSVEDIAFAMYWWFDLPEEEIYNQYPGAKIKDERHLLLISMFVLAYADGDFCEKEEYIIRYIAYHMRLTESDYENTLIEDFLNWDYGFDNEEKIKEGYKQYRKARHKRDGGYWYRDAMGRKKWHAFPKDEDDEKEETSNQSDKQDNTTPHIPSELEKAYAVLGIPVDATPSEINACKRNLLRRNHPDLVATRGQEAVNAATAKCQLINQAYELLKANGKC